MTVNKAPLTITAAGNTKTYDSGITASATPTVSGLVSGSGDTVTGLAETYDNKNYGSGHTLTVSAYTVNDGNSGGNYSVSKVTSTAGVINKAGLTITAAGNTKTYDGGITASATPTASGLMGSDYLSGLAEIYSTRSAGTGKTLMVSAYTVNDGDGGANYTVSTATSTAGVINPAPLTLTATPNTKNYDGTTTATNTPIITVGSLQTGDTSTTFTEAYTDPNVGTGKTIMPAGIVIDGNGGLNYNYTYSPNYNGVIIPTNGPPTINAEPTNQVVCVGSPAMFTVAATAAG